MKVPDVLDQRDRHVLGVGLLLAFGVLFVLVFGAAALGLAVRVFTLAAGWGG